VSYPSALLALIEWVADGVEQGLSNEHTMEASMQAFEQIEEKTMDQSSAVLPGRFWHGNCRRESAPTIRSARSQPA
jgi:hypothetical protein